MTNLEKEIIKTGFRYEDNGDGTFDVCYDHDKDSWFNTSAKCRATVREDGNAWYVNANTGFGEGEYHKADWTLLDAIKDQCGDVQS